MSKPLPGICDIVDFRKHAVATKRNIRLTQERLLTFVVTYRGRGVVTFALEYFANSNDPECLHKIELEASEVERICDGEIGVIGKLEITKKCGNVTIIPVGSDDKDCVITVTSEEYENLIDVVEDDYVDYELMAKFTGDIDGMGTVRMTIVKENLVLALLHYTYGVSEKFRRHMDDGEFAAQLMNKVTVEDVNQFLRFTNLRIACDEPLRNIYCMGSVLHNNLMRGRTTPSMNYFIHLLVCRKYQGEEDQTTRIDESALALLAKIDF